MEDKVYLFDTTLRDGQQTTGVNFSVSDKMNISQHLDDLGIDYIEGGWPGANPTDNDFFSRNTKFSIESLRNLNENTIKLFNYNEINHKLKNIKSNFQKESFWRFIKNNISFVNQAKEWEEVITKINNAKDLNIDDNFINTAVDELPEDPFDETTWDHWTSKINKKTGLKGKDLFMPLRLILTGKSHGPELKYLLPLFDRDEILQKLGKI